MDAPAYYEQVPPEASIKALARYAVRVRKATGENHVGVAKGKRFEASLGTPWKRSSLVFARCGIYSESAAISTLPSGRPC